MRQDAERCWVVHVKHIRHGILHYVIYSGERSLLQFPTFTVTVKDLFELLANQTIKRISLQFVILISLKHKDHFFDQSECHGLFSRLLYRIIALYLYHEEMSSDLDLQAWKKDVEKVCPTAHQTGKYRIIREGDEEWA